MFSLTETFVVFRLHYGCSFHTGNRCTGSFCGLVNVLAYLVSALAVPMPTCVRAQLNGIFSLLIDHMASVPFI